MSLRQIRRGLRALFRRNAAGREIADEVESFLDNTAAEFESRGMSRQEARRAATLECGSALNFREQVGSYGWENVFLGPLSDLAQAARRLCRAPGFAISSILTLVLGIGTSAAIFSILDVVLLRPLPYPHSERLVALNHTAPGIHIKSLNLSVSLYFTYREESRVFSDVAMWIGGAWTVTGLAEPEQVRGLSATYGFLPMLGVQPALGRRFGPSDDDPRSERTVMLADGYWKAHFGGNPAVLGRPLLLDGNAYTIIGILPGSFQFLDQPISLLTPLRFNRAEVRLISFCCRGVARLKPGVTVAEANADVARMLLLAPSKFPINSGYTLSAFTGARIAPDLLPLKDVLVGNVGNTLWVLMAGVTIVLLIACANVANLVLVRADGRRVELALRMALGAGWGRIARELLLESLLLAAAGGALGLALAYTALRLLVASELTHLPRLHEISIDPLVVAFVFATSLGAGLLFGLAPVLQYARPRIAESLRGSSRSASPAKERHRARNLLVAVQVALALVLLIAAGLMIRTFHALRDVDPGFSAAPMETVSITIPDKQVMAGEQVIRMEEAILRKIEAIPGVSAAAIADSVPLNSCCTNNPIWAADQVYVAGTIPPIRRYRWISPGYFSTIGNHLIAGRDLTWAETYGTTAAAVVSENLARELWHDPRAAIGKQIRDAGGDWREVIGVAADVRDNGVDQPVPAIVYWPLLLKNFDGGKGSAVIRSIVYFIRTPRAGTTAFRQELQQVVAAVNPTLPLASLNTLGSIYDQSLARQSLTLVLLAIAGWMALVLAVVGVYGVIAYAVARRRREIGIRIALGASRGAVTGLFVWNGLVVSAAGAGCGLAAAFALTRLMRSILYAVSPSDPLTYLAACAALILSAILASYLPALRAARIDPADTLRME